MDNSFFILSEKELIIERFHICTWDFKDRKSFIELGFEIENSSSLGDETNLTFTAPFLREIKEEAIICLADRLKLRENSKFIFNDSVKSSIPIDDDRNGTILDFEIRGNLTVIPVKEKKINKKSGAVYLKIKTPKQAKGNIYFRILIELPFKTIAISKGSFSKTMYIFDLKVNEQRNLPKEVFEEMEQKNQSLSIIHNCFCLHIIPDTFEISFIDDKKLKNIRELEYLAFKKYLPDKVKGLKKEEHMIVFNKASKDRSYTFFSTFTKEKLGHKQVLFTLAANIFCSLLLIITTNEKYCFSDLKSIPWTVYVVGVFFLALLFYMMYLILPQTYRWVSNKIMDS